MLLAGAAIIVPLLNFAPKLYQWFVQNLMTKLYRRLRIVEKQMQNQLTAPQVAALQADFEHSDLFFDLNLHIKSMREHLATRLAEVRSQTAKVA